MNQGTTGLRYWQGMVGGLGAQGVGVTGGGTASTHGTCPVRDGGEEAQETSRWGQPSLV